VLLNFSLSRYIFSAPFIKLVFLLTRYIALDNHSTEAQRFAFGNNLDAFLCTCFFVTAEQYFLFKK